MKKIFLAIITLFALVMSGCSKDAFFGSFPDSVGNPVVEPVSTEMPDIVFMRRTSYNRYEHGLDGSSKESVGSIAFFDRNGSYYHTDDNEIVLLSNAELVEAFKESDERITKSSAICDVDELRENFDKLLKVAGNKEYKLVYPEALPSVEDDHITWYGLYYDKNGKLLALPIHERLRMTEIEANDDRANEICEWYTGAAKKQ